MPEVKFGTSQINNPTPKLWGRISTSLRYTFVSAIGLFAGTDMIPPGIVKWITFGLSMAILLLKAIDMGLGVQEDDSQPKQ